MKWVPECTFAVGSLKGKCSLFVYLFSFYTKLFVRTFNQHGKEAGPSFTASLELQIGRHGVPGCPGQTGLLMKEAEQFVLISLLHLLLDPTSIDM